MAPEPASPLISSSRPLNISGFVVTVPPDLPASSDTKPSSRHLAIPTPLISAPDTSD